MEALPVHLTIGLTTATYPLPVHLTIGLTTATYPLPVHLTTRHPVRSVDAAELLDALDLGGSRHDWASRRASAAARRVPASLDLAQCAALRNAVDAASMETLDSVDGLLEYQLTLTSADFEELVGADAFARLNFLAAEAHAETRPGRFQDSSETLPRRFRDSSENSASWALKRPPTRRTRVTLTDTQHKTLLQRRAAALPCGILGALTAASRPRRRMPSFSRRCAPPPPPPRARQASPPRRTRSPRSRTRSSSGGTAPPRGRGSSASTSTGRVSVTSARSHLWR